MAASNNGNENNGSSSVAVKALAGVRVVTVAAIERNSGISCAIARSRHHLAGESVSARVMAKSGSSETAASGIMAAKAWQQLGMAKRISVWRHGISASSENHQQRMAWRRAYGISA